MTLFAPTRPAPLELRTPGGLAQALALPAEAVLQDSFAPEPGVTAASRERWTWVQTAQRLADAHGRGRALEILNTYGAAP